jgi:HSP20 family protein
MKTHITPWNPLREMEDMQNRLAAFWRGEPVHFNGSEGALFKADWSPRVDIVEDDKEFLVKAELPETKREDMKVTVQDGVLTISGERKLAKEEKDKKYHRLEREYGSFVRSFTLPAGTNGEKVSADFKEGLLTVHLPKDAKAGAKTVEVKSN